MEINGTLFETLCIVYLQQCKGYNVFVHIIGGIIYCNGQRVYKSTKSSTKTDFDYTYRIPLLFALKRNKYKVKFMATHLFALFQIPV